MHTRFLAAVQRTVDVRRIEEACLDELVRERRARAPAPAAPAPAGEAAPAPGRVTSEGLPPPPSPASRARRDAGHLTDEQVLAQFSKWRGAKEKLDRAASRMEHSARPGVFLAPPAVRSSVRAPPAAAEDVASRPPPKM